MAQCEHGIVGDMGCVSCMSDAMRTVRSSNTDGTWTHQRDSQYIYIGARHVSREFLVEVFKELQILTRMKTLGEDPPAIAQFAVIMLEQVLEEIEQDVKEELSKGSKLPPTLDPNSPEYVPGDARSRADADSFGGSDF